MMPVRINTASAFALAAEQRRRAHWHWLSARRAVVMVALLLGMPVGVGFAATYAAPPEPAEVQQKPDRHDKPEADGKRDDQDKDADHKNANKTGDTSASKNGSSRKNGDTGRDEGAARDEDQDKDDLADKLIRQATGQGGGDDVMERIVNMMNATARRLEIEFDAGAETRAMQDGIIAQLDDAIKRAAHNTRRQSGNPSQSNPDRRSGRPKQQPSKPDSQAGSKAEQGRAPGQSAGTTGKADTSGAGTRGEPLRERRRAWGHLPARDRDEVIEGIDEVFLSRYREWIECYYRALQSADQENTPP